MVTALPVSTHSPAPSRALRGLAGRLASSSAERPVFEADAGPEADWREEPPIDYQQLRQRLRGGDAVIHRILSLFPDECAAGLTELQALIASRRWEASAEVAHRLKGAAGTIAASDLRAAASTIEGACRREEMEAVQSALLDLYHEALRTTEYVRSILVRS
jgi:HPt (histidine-containing phosphotransfer) domain-containing protein